MPPKHLRQPFDPLRYRPRAAFKSPNVARGDPVGALVAQSSAELLCAKIEIFSDRPQFLAGHRSHIDLVVQEPEDLAPR
jgi:hypothetical protein